MDYKQAKSLLRSLESGEIIPVTKVASNLAEHAQAGKIQATVITRDGYGLGVVMSIEAFNQLRELAYEGLDYLEEKEREQALPQDEVAELSRAVNE
jgi:hypothetical protein